MAEKYLESLISQAPHLGDHIERIKDFHHRRLWHQVTLALQTFVKLPEALELDLVEFYNKFISTFEVRLNQLTFVRLIWDISHQLKGADRVQFLKKISELPKVQQNDEAFIDSRSLLGRVLIECGENKAAKEVLLRANEKLEATTGVDASVYASLFLSWSSYYKAINDPTQFYKYTIQYIAYTQIDLLPKSKLIDLAFDLGIAALIGDNIFNFGDLLEHPVIETLIGTDREWLAEIILNFNKGNIKKWKQLQIDHENILKSHPGLANTSLLNKKIALMALVELSFQRISVDRNITFQDIAITTQNESVELLVMNAISLGLIRATIDEVSQIVTVQWVQPRILDLSQIASMGQNIETWSNKVKTSLKNMETGIISELIS